MNYRLVQSKRKTIAIRICSDGSLEVRAPFHVRQNQIEELLIKKQSWIQKNQTSIQQIAKLRSEFHLEIGNDLPFLGIYYPIYEGNHIGFSQMGFSVRAGEPVKTQIEKIFRKEAKIFLSKKIQELSALVSVEPTRLTITGASSCFGSCSSKNAVSLTWKLMMASEELIEYVVIHELCHILEHNHSERFWKMVNHYLPDYKIREIKLKEFSKYLQTQNWN